MKVKSESEVLSRVRLLETPWTAAHQAPPSMGFSRQEYWGGVPLPSLLHSSGQHRSSKDGCPAGSKHSDGFPVIVHHSEAQVLVFSALHLPSWATFLALCSLSGLLRAPQGWVGRPWPSSMVSLSLLPFLSLSPLGLVLALCRPLCTSSWLQSLSRSSSLGLPEHPRLLDPVLLLHNGPC